MSDIPNSSGTIPSAGQVAASQHPVVSATTVPPPPPGQPPMGAPPFTYQAAPSSAQLPPVESHPSLVDSLPVVSQLYAYSSIPPLVYSRPRPTVTTLEQFRYGMPQVPDFTATPVTPPPRIPTSFPTVVPVTTPPLPRAPLQAAAIDMRSDLVDHVACLTEVVRRQVYWQIRQTESLMDTQQHLEYIGNMLQENTGFNPGAQPVSDENSTWSPIQDLPEGLESAFISPNNHQETAHCSSVLRDDASSPFHPYLTPNHAVSFRKHRHLRCSKCHQKGHPSRLCPRRLLTGCYLGGEPSHRMTDRRDYMHTSSFLPPSAQAYQQNRQNFSSAVPSSGHPPPSIRPTSSSEPNITVPNPQPQTMCDLCGQLAHQGDKYGP